MRISVKIIPAAFFVNWTRSLISMQWCSCMDRNVGYAVHSLVPAEKAFPTIFNASP